VKQAHISRSSLLCLPEGDLGALDLLIEGGPRYLGSFPTLSGLNHRHARGGVKLASLNSYRRASYLIYNTFKEC